MTTQWYFDTIEEAKAAMPEWDRIFTTAPDWDADEFLIGKFVPTAGNGSEGPICIVNSELWVDDETGWTVIKRRGEPNVELIVDQIRNAETRDEAIQVARSYFDDTMHFGEDIIR